MRYIETEYKFRLAECLSLKKRLRNLGARKIRHVRQLDTYYNAPHRDFLAPTSISEWFRTREEEGRTSINYKRWLPLDVEEKTHCDEFETVLEDGEAVQRLLEALDFRELVKVDKEREEWVLGDCFIVALDSVVGLGSFVEFEYKGDVESVEEASQRLMDLIDELQVELGERDKRGYPYQLLEQQRGVAMRSALVLA